MGPQNSRSLKYWANDETGFMTGLFYSTKILKGLLAQKLKNGSDIYEHVHFPNGVDLWGRRVECGQNGQKLHENYKINIFGAKQWGDMGVQRQFFG